jgi:hypothetical protein
MRQFDNFGRLADDKCALVTKELQNRSIGDYMLYNSFVTSEPKRDLKEFKDFVVNNQNLRYKDGYGFLNGNVVDTDSDIRNGAKFTNDREKSQLTTRWYQAVPSFNKGGLIVNVDTRLKFAEDTSFIRSCQKTSEKDFDRFIPLTPCLADVVQNPEHIIPKWVNGGESTRNYVHDAEFLQQCGFVNNGTGWVRASHT